MTNNLFIESSQIFIRFVKDRGNGSFHNSLKALFPDYKARYLESALT